MPHGLQSCTDMEKCTHVFLHQDTTRWALEPPYSGPYLVLLRREKTLQLLMCGRPITVSADGVKPAYILNGTDCGNNSFNPLVDATPAVASPAIPPHELNAPVVTSIFLLASTSDQPNPWRMGGGVMWEPPTVKRALPNQHSPWQLQHSLVYVPPIGNV
jgi:hypothetical protein